VGIILVWRHAVNILSVDSGRRIVGRIFWMTLVAALAGVSTQASAQVPLHDSRYEMVTTQLGQNISFGASIRRPLRQRGWEDHNWFRPSNQVIILDKRTGQLWSWYESF
jgi:hypothetical protein